MLFPGPLRPLIDNREHLRDNLVWLEGTHNFELFYKVGTCTPPLALNGATKIERIALRRRVLPKLYHYRVMGSGVWTFLKHIFDWEPRVIFGLAIRSYNS